MIRSLASLVRLYRTLGHLWRPMVTYEYGDLRPPTPTFGHLRPPTATFGHATEIREGVGVWGSRGHGRACQRYDSPVGFEEFRSLPEQIADSCVKPTRRSQCVKLLRHAKVRNLHPAIVTDQDIRRP